MRRNVSKYLHVVCAMGAAAWISNSAAAQDPGTTPSADSPAEGVPDAQGPGTDDDVNNAAPADPDPDPTVPGIEGDGTLETRVEEQAGTGGDVAYASKGVVELGGAGSWTGSSEGQQIALNPFIGWFIIDNLQLSAILNVAWTHIDGADEDYTTLGLFVEPSFHLPFTNRVLGFAGLGIGPAYNNEDFGFAVRPRLGVDILVGRSGIFRPAFEVTWSTADVVTQQGQTLIGANIVYGISFGYSVML